MRDDNKWYFSRICSIYNCFLIVIIQLYFNSDIESLWSGFMIIKFDMNIYCSIKSELMNSNEASWCKSFIKIELFK